MKLGQGIAPGAPIAPSLADTCEERAPFLISQQGIHDTSTYNLRGRQTALTNINAGSICSRSIYRILMPNGCLGREPIPLRRRLESPGQVPGLFHLGPSKRPARNVPERPKGALGTLSSQQARNERAPARPRASCRAKSGAVPAHSGLKSARGRRNPLKAPVADLHPRPRYVWLCP